MTDQIAILIIVGLAVIFFCLWTFSNRQKRKYEKERLERKRELDKLKSDARAAAQKKTD
jgi:FtsZ-interacting cell division protein ZipA